MHQRQQWRQTALAARLALPPTTVAAYSDAIADHLRAGLPGRHRRWPEVHLAFCWPIQNEPDLRPLLSNWLDIGVRPCLPVVVAPAQALAFRPWTPDTPLAPDRYGIPTPVDGAYVTPDILLLPCNAFDAAGYRLGYGGGFFDRTLAALPQALAIGVAYAAAELPSIQPGPHDRPLAAIVTEQGWRDCVASAV
jgi:5,10-methenyltetrahydrofolate synthetase